MNIEKTNLKLQIPPQAEKIIGVLEDAGYEAYVVGGCVRDCVLGRVPNDWDITTSAPPERVKELFRRTVDTGIRHGTVTVLMGHEPYEVTTYRIDGLYEDCRHPKEVTFTGELREDLCRRDFTINAMAYHPVRGLVDLFGGVDDIASGVIRCVGDPEARFSEDALRMLRALRFSAQLGFSVEEGTKEAIRHKAASLQHISAEAFYSFRPGCPKKVTFLNPATDLESGIFGYTLRRQDDNINNPLNWIDLYHEQPAAEADWKGPMQLSCYEGSTADRMYAYKVKKVYLR